MNWHNAKRLVFHILFSLLFVNPSFAWQQAGQLQKGFVYVDKVIPDLKIELRYYSAHNFVGERINGYMKPRCILTKEAAAALKKVQQELKPFGLGLKIFDAYRPQQAVDHFVSWASILSDTRMKGEFYPHVNKSDLFKDDYVAARSGHSRGSTVDLTIVSLQGEVPGKELDMGSGFDFFGPESWPEYQELTAGQRANRLLLQIIMKKNGFQPYAKEWWHFTLKNEPFPKTYFNFPIQ
jgi:zinc D-Ala-D-Ala dipeptidase